MANILPQNWQRRIENAVRAVEDAGILAAPPLPMAETFFVEITSTTQTDGRYPGNGRRYDASAKTWGDEEDCWVVDANSVPLQTGVQYLARLWQSGIGSPAKPVLITDRDGVGAGGGTSGTATITADQNNYAVPYDTTFLDPDADRTITGITGGAAGAVYTITNSDTVGGSNDVILANQSGSSDAANRIITPDGSSLTIPPGYSATLIYDATVSRWVVIGGSAVAAAEAAAISGPVLIASGSASGAATLDITGLTGYRTYWIILDSVLSSAAGGSQTRMRTSTDNGSNYDSGGSDYLLVVGTGDHFPLWNAQDIADSTANSAGEIKLYSPGDSTFYKMIEAQGVFGNSTSRGVFNHATAMRAATADVNAVRFYLASGNISATYRVYGLP